MSIAAQQVREAFYQLPEDERAQLAREFSEDDHFEISEEVKERVLAEVEAARLNPDEGISWEELKTKLLNQTP